MFDPAQMFALDEPNVMMNLMMNLKTVYHKSRSSGRVKKHVRHATCDLYCSVVERLFLAAHT